VDVYTKIIEKIIRAQEAIIGPVAIEQAKRVPGLKLDWDKHEIVINGDENKTVNNLVEIYQELFGQISKEVSIEAAAPYLSLLPKNQLPEMLK
jgi:hypothetical protein